MTDLLEWLIFADQGKRSGGADLMKRKKIWKAVVLSLTLACAVSGCAQGKKHGLDPKKPTVITVWHAYNAFAKTKFDEKVTEFNETKGGGCLRLWFEW